MKQGIPFYRVRNGNGFWEPTARMKARGFHSVPCGKDGPGARAVAETWNQRWQTARRAGAPYNGGDQPGTDAPNNIGYVYFLRVAGRVKIGFSKDPFVRVSELKTGLTEQPTSIVAIRAQREDEKRLHRRLAAFRTSGEWFAESAAVLRTMHRWAAFGRPMHDNPTEQIEKKTTALSDFFESDVGSEQPDAG